MNRQLFTAFGTGNVAVLGQSIDIGSIAWNKHKDFEGVFLKNLVTPEHTNGLFSCHLVRIEPGKKIGLHTHPTSIELHEVIAGEGKCLTVHGEIPYLPGKMAVLPENSQHEVLAGEKGLYLFAKFVTVKN